MPNTKKRRTEGIAPIRLVVDPDEPGHPSLSISRSDLKALHSDYFDTILEGTGEGDGTTITLKCSGLATRGWKAWNSLFALMTSRSQSSVPEHTTLHQPADLLMLLNYFFGPGHPLVKDVTQYLGTLLSTDRKTASTTVDAISLGSQGLAQLDRIAQYPELHSLLGFKPDASHYLVLPDHKASMPAYLDLGDPLRQNGLTHIWILWSRSLLKSAIPHIAKRALVSEPCERLRTRVQQWLGGFDLLALIATYPHALVAGGSVVTSQLDIPHIRSDSDVDVWVFRQDRDTVLRLVEAIGRACAGTVFVVQDALVTAVCPTWQCSIQIILVEHAVPWWVVNEFDLDYVKAYADGQQLWVTPECRVAWDTRRVTRLSTPSAKAHRLEKARAKGFEVCLPSKVKIFDDLDQNKRWKYFHPALNNPPEHTRTVLRAMWPRATVTLSPAEVAAAYTGRPLHSHIPLHVYVENPKTALELCAQLPSPLLGPMENIGSAEHPIHAQKLRHAVGFTVNALRGLYHVNINLPAVNTRLRVHLDLVHNQEHQALEQLLEKVDDALRTECDSKWFQGSLRPCETSHPANKCIRVSCYSGSTRWLNENGEKIDPAKCGTIIPAFRMKARIIFVVWNVGHATVVVAADEVRVYRSQFAASLLAHPKLRMYVSSD